MRLGVAVSGSREVGEDLAQEAFLRAARKIPSLGGTEVRPYLRKTVIDLWRNRLRRYAIERRHPTTTLPTPTEHGNDDHEAFWIAVRKLAPRQRACLVLRYYEDLSEIQTAQIMGFSVGTVKSQTSRALEHLRKELDDGTG